MCSSSPETPDVVVRDPKADARKAAAEAAKKANKELAAIRARKAKSTLLARGAAGVEGTGNTLLAQAVGKQRLGS